MGTLNRCQGHQIILKGTFWIILNRHCFNGLLSRDVPITAKLVRVIYPCFLLKKLFMRIEPAWHLNVLKWFNIYLSKLIILFGKASGMYNLTQEEGLWGMNWVFNKIFCKLKVIVQNLKNRAWNLGKETEEK